MEDWMKQLVGFALLASTLASATLAGQAPYPASASNVPISSRDRVYSADQFSNTVSVVDPSRNTLLGVIRLGDPQPANLSPLYHGQVLVHGMGFSPDGKTLAVVSIGSNSVTFIDTATNKIKHTTYVGRSPHEAFFTPDGHEVWVTIRGENYISVLSPDTFSEVRRVETPAGPGMTIFSPDGRYGFVCSSFNPELVIVDVHSHVVVDRQAQPSPFCPNIAAAPDGTQIWYTLKDIGKAVVISGKPPFSKLTEIDTGPITNHVNFAYNAHGQFAFVTVGGLNEVQVFRTSDFSKVATIPVGKLPHGIWPSGDGTRVYVGLENADVIAAIDTLTDEVIANIPVGQAPQALAYVPNAIPIGDGRQDLEQLGLAGVAAHIVLGPPNSDPAKSPTSVSLFDQGLVQVVQASVTGLAPKSAYVLALSSKSDGSGPTEPLATFTTNPAGSAIVNAIGRIRQLVQEAPQEQRQFLVITRAGASGSQEVVQIQL
jgi:YVTN family beta-propeller protein